VGHALEDVLVRGPLEPERALAVLARVADAPDAAVARSGPLQYLSPEQLVGRDEGKRSEVYSLSALLYQYLTGSVPFPHGRRRAVLFWHLHAPRPRPTDLRPELPTAIDQVIARGMAPDPGARHPNADAFLEDARRALSSAAGAQLRPVRPAPSASPAARRARGRGGRRRRASSPLPVALGLAVAAGAAGFAVAGALDDPPSPRPALATAGPVQLTTPTDWRPSPSPLTVAGLRLADPVVLAPSIGRGRLAAGMATPRAVVALLARLHASAPAGELVALGRIEARRYRAARVPVLAGAATLYVAPADVGVATIACLTGGASTAGSFMSRCERVAASLRLAQGRSRPAGPSARQAAGLRRALRRLNAARSSYRSRLARSRSAVQQAAAARTVARAHLRAGRSVRSLALTGLAQPGRRAAIGALERSAAAYRDAARAAVRGESGGYARARRSALAADAALRRALRMLRVVGYAG
jgi:hypothetical protein